MGRVWTVNSGCKWFFPLMQICTARSSSYQSQRDNSLESLCCIHMPMPHVLGYVSYQCNASTTACTAQVHLIACSDLIFSPNQLTWAPKERQEFSTLLLNWQSNIWPLAPLWSLATMTCVLHAKQHLVLCQHQAAAQAKGFLVVTMRLHLADMWAEKTPRKFGQLLYEQRGSRKRTMAWSSLRSWWVTIGALLIESAEVTEMHTSLNINRASLRGTCVTGWWGKASLRSNVPLFQCLLYMLHRLVSQSFP